MPKGRKPKAPTGEEKMAPKRATPKKRADNGAMKETIILQSAGIEWNVAELREKVIATYVAEGHRQGWIKQLELYVKPEEHRVYYVINGKTTGSIGIE